MHSGCTPTRRRGVFKVAYGCSGRESLIGPFNNVSPRMRRPMYSDGLRNRIWSVAVCYVPQIEQVTNTGRPLQMTVMQVIEAKKCKCCKSFHVGKTG